MPILVVVTFGGLSFWLTHLPVLLIRSIQQRHDNRLSRGVFIEIRYPRENLFLSFFKGIGLYSPIMELVSQAREIL